MEAMQIVNAGSPQTAPAHIVEAQRAASRFAVPRLD
jgi:hypothetical protein